MSEWPELMTVAEVALLLRVSKMTVYRSLQRGVLPSVRAGRSIRVPKSAVLEFIDTGWARPHGDEYCPRCRFYIGHDIDCPSN